MTKKENRLPLPAWLAYLLACTMLFTGASFARYLTRAEDSDDARAAACVIETKETGAADTAITGSGNAAYTFTVSNQKDGQVSEVALTYDVVVTVDGTLPAGAAITLDGRTWNVSGNRHTFTGAGTFEAGKDEEHTHTLAVSVSDIADAANVSIDVAVHAEQID